MKRKTVFTIASVVLIGGPLFVFQRLNKARGNSHVTAEPIVHEAGAQDSDAAAPAATTTAASVLAPALAPTTAMARIEETHEKVIHYAVVTPVYETHTKEVRYTVMVPVTETHVKQVPYTVMRAITSEPVPPTNSEPTDRIVRTVAHVPETKVKSVCYTVTKMVPEQRSKMVAYRTCRMVTETKQKTVQYTTVRFVPVAVLQNQLEQQRENAIEPLSQLVLHHPGSI